MPVLWLLLRRVQDQRSSELSPQKIAIGQKHLVVRNSKDMAQGKHIQAFKGEGSSAKEFFGWDEVQLVCVDYGRGILEFLPFAALWRNNSQKDLFSFQTGSFSTQK